MSANGTNVNYKTITENVLETIDKNLKEVTKHL